MEKNEKEISNEELNPRESTEAQEDSKTSESKEQKKKECRKKMSREQELQQKVEEATQMAAEAKDQYVRLAAEFDNFRRRTAKERLELISTASEGVLVGFLPILDDCQRAVEALRKTDASDAAIEGTELIMNKLEGFLKGKGIERIDAKGKPFDTDFHEAVAQFPVEEDNKKNTVIDIAQEGYTLNGKVVRFAKVVVGI